VRYSVLGKRKRAFAKVIVRKALEATHSRRALAGLLRLPSPAVRFDAHRNAPADMTSNDAEGGR
jgi:hypothetical protein